MSITERFDSGINKYIIGDLTEEEREQAKEDGYTLFSKGVTANDPPKKYEVWIK